MKRSQFIRAFWVCLRLGALLSSSRKQKWPSLCWARPAPALLLPVYCSWRRESFLKIPFTSIFLRFYLSSINK